MSRNTTDLDEQILLALAKPYLHERAEAVKQLISNREKLARIDELENLPWKRIDKYGINTPYVTKKWLTERKATLRKELDREEPTHE